MQVIEAGASILQGETGIGVPHGLARFCSSPAWAEAALSASLYRAASSRRAAHLHYHSLTFDVGMKQDAGHTPCQGLYDRHTFNYKVL